MLKIGYLWIVVQTLVAIPKEHCLYVMVLMKVTIYILWRNGINFLRIIIREAQLLTVYFGIPCRTLVK